jgi:3-methyladenine DNA glycosylase AlkD
VTANPGERTPAEAGGSGAAETAAQWERELRGLGTAERAVSEKAYLKSDLEFAGVPVPAMRAMVAAWCQARPGLGHDELTGLVRALWASPLYESRQSAVILLERTVRLLGPADMALLEDLLRTSRTWALVDGLAANVAGGLVDRDPGLAAILDRWAGDADFWLRRSAMLALLRPLRRDDRAFERFAGYADAMLEEKEFFIRKAIGWVLREAGKRDPGRVAAWLAPRVHRASGVTVREAVKPLPADVRAILLAGYRDKRPVRCEHEGTDSTD